MTITARDIQLLEGRDDFGGWGYLGHELRTDVSDRALAAAATYLDLNIDDVFLWANSRVARHWMDQHGEHAQMASFQGRLIDSMREWLPRLAAEVA